MEVPKDFSFKFEAECDFCSKICALVVVKNEKKSCLECAEKKIKEIGYDSNKINLDEKTKQELNEIIKKKLEEAKEK